MVLALAAWEARTTGVPVMALGATAGYWLVFHAISGPGSETAQFAAYVLLSLTTFLNMYVVLTPLYPDNPGVSDWLRIGGTIRGTPAVTLIAPCVYSS